MMAIKHYLKDVLQKLGKWLFKLEMFRALQAEMVRMIIPLTGIQFVRT
jgi:hypothetical protein